MAKKIGRPSHQPTDVTRGKVNALAAYGITEYEIATELDIAPKTLRLHYRTELDTGHIRAKAKVAEFLVNMATGKLGPLVRDRDGKVVFDKNGDPLKETDFRSATQAAIFYLKTQGRWTEQLTLNLNTADEVAAEARERLARGVARLTAVKAAAEAVEQPDSGTS